MAEHCKLSSYSPAEKRQALLVAAQWYAQLCADEVSQDEKSAWQAWLAGHVQRHNKVLVSPEQADLNHWAWQQVEKLQTNMQGLPNTIASDLAVNSLTSVEPHFNQERRTAMRSLMVILGTGILGWAGYRADLPYTKTLTSLLHTLTAEQTSAVGQVRVVVLSDGSQVTLNTASAIDIQYSTTERRIFLRQGEIMVQTAKSLVDSRDARPFIVETTYGDIQALGTRFSVQLLDNNTAVNVYQHSVRVTNSQGQQQVCSVGNSLKFNRNHFSFIDPQLASDAWTENMLVVTNMPLPDFVKEVGRYRTGVLRCDESLRQYRVSGAFNTQNTEQILSAIEKSFPIAVNSYTRLWVNVVPIA